MSLSNFFFLVYLVLPVVTLYAADNTPPIKSEKIGTYYFVKNFGHLHQNPSLYSSSLSTVACGQPVAVYNVTQGSKVLYSGDSTWTSVKVGPYEGFVRRRDIAVKREVCFNERYPKLYDLFEFDVAQLYYFGKLNDQVVEGESEVR